MYPVQQVLHLYLLVLTLEICMCYIPFTEAGRPYLNYLELIGPCSLFHSYSKYCLFFST